MAQMVSLFQNLGENKMDKKDLRSLTLEQLQIELENMGEKSFRAKQIFSWLHSRQVRDIDSMTNISKALREKLKENFELRNIEIVEKLVAHEDNTVKYLFDVGNSMVIESVLMRYSYGNAVCISTQVGCRMGCTFLCLYCRRVGKKSLSWGNGGADLRDTEGHRRKSFKCCING